MVVGSPPLEVGQQVWSLLGRGPGAARQRCYPLTNRQIQPFDKSGIESSREILFLQSGIESSVCSKAHHVRHTNQLAPLVAFLHLTVDQASHHLPLASMLPSATRLDPVSKMGRQSIKVQV